MERFIKNNIKWVLGIIVGLIIGGTTVYAATIINANQVVYSSRTVEKALDDLYVSAEKIKKIQKFCQLKSGKKEIVGAKYECDPGDGEKRIFYILSVNKNTVDLIMERNITSESITWNDAMKYFRSGEGLAVKTSWVNVLNVDLPKAQTILDTIGFDIIVSDAYNTWWCFGSGKKDLPGQFPYCTNTNQETYAWLFNHLLDCKHGGCTDDSDATSSGYWTRDIMSGSTHIWAVREVGSLDHYVSYTKVLGVRPVITILKDNLYE